MKAKLRGSMTAVMEFLGLLGTISLIGVSVMMACDAIMRSFFSSPLLGVGELAPLVSAVAVACFLPLSFLDDSHISMRVLEVVARGGLRTFIKLFAGAASTCVLALIGRGLVLYTLDAGESGTTTWFLAVPIAPWWAVISALVIFTTAVQAYLVYRVIKPEA